MNLIEALIAVPDHRKPRGIRHPLWLILAIILLGSCTGYWGYKPLVEFTENHRATLIKLLELPSDTREPSDSTFRNIIHSLDFEIIAVRWFSDFQHWRQTATGRWYTDWCDRSHGRKRFSPSFERHPRSPDLANLADGCRQGTARRVAATGTGYQREVNDGNFQGRSRTLLRIDRYGDRQSILNRKITLTEVAPKHLPLLDYE